MTDEFACLQKVFMTRDLQDRFGAIHERLALNLETLDIYHGQHRNRHILWTLLCVKAFLSKVYDIELCVEELLSDSKGFLLYRRTEMRYE